MQCAHVVKWMYVEAVMWQEKYSRNSPADVTV